MRSRRARPRWAARVALALALVACSDERPPASGVSPLNDVELPSLGCSAAPANEGECARRADCGQGQLCTRDERAEPVDRAPVVLRCGPPLGTAAARARCVDAGECESGLCGLAGVCLEPCAETADCPRGQSCQSVEVRVGDDMLAPVTACARVAAYASDVRVQVGEPAALRGGRLNRFSLAGLAQTNLILLKAECGRTLRMERIVDRTTQRVLFDAARQLEGVVQINPSLNEGALLPLLLPNNPRLVIGTGDYELGVSVDADTALRVIRVEREKRGRVLDLNVFYVGGGTAAEPTGLRPGSPEFADVLARLGERYAEIGITLGALREYDVVGALREELAVLEVSTAGAGEGAGREDVAGLSRLFELSAGVEDGGANVFVVQKMGPLFGISGGTPGALGLHGSALSGVALALDSVGLERADQVLFHELGHQLGLFHTSEIDGFEVEPLSDTPACSAERDSDGDGVLRGAECVDHGADNLMFWEGGSDALSPQQIDVLTRALLLR